MSSDAAEPEASGLLCNLKKLVRYLTKLVSPQKPSPENAALAKATETHMESPKPASINADVTEPKALRLARYLREFARLRSVVVRDVDKYELVLWFGDMPQEPECRSPAWRDDFASDEPWLEVCKPQFPVPPKVPDALLPWIDQEALGRATEEMPPLLQTRLEPDPNVELGEGEEPPLIERHIRDYPDIIEIYERFRPIWQAWSDEYRRCDAIQKIYAELFHLRAQIQKQEEIVELVLGLGLLDWPETQEKSVRIRRHVVAARVNLQFDPSVGVIRLEPPAEGAKLQIEDDMLGPEMRPEQGQYESMRAKLEAIDDNIWDRSAIFPAIKFWAEALHPNSQWSTDLQPVAGTDDKPAVSFAPALILRKRVQRGMERIYNQMISQLAEPSIRVPPGWSGLIEDGGDDEAPDAPPQTGPTGDRLTPQEIYFPLPANREQRRIVEAIGRQRGVLVQGPPGTGKSHTIANLICHMLATGKRMLVTAETERALRVLKDKLPKEIQPLCVSLLGQTGDAFAELNSAVQGITARLNSWSREAYDHRIEEIDGEISAKRRSMWETDAELRQLRQAETLPFTLLYGAYRGSALQIAQRVARERDRYGWLQLPNNASEHPPVGKDDILSWLRICRAYKEEQIAEAKLRILSPEQLPSPDVFGAGVVAERNAKQALAEITEFLKDPVYRRIAELDSKIRDNFKSRLQVLDNRHRQLLQRGYEWVADAISECLGDRPARWRALHNQSVELLDRIEELLVALRSASVSIPPEFELARVRADADVLLQYFRRGGKWKRLGVITPKEVKKRRYLRERIQVNGQPITTESQLRILRDYLDVELSFAALDEAWRDCGGGVPKGSQQQIRLTATKEQVVALGDVLSHADECLNLGRSGNSEFSSVPLPDWKNGETEKWLDLIRAVEIEKKYKFFEDKITACLRDLQAVQNLEDAHPVIRSLVKAVEERDIPGYGEAYDKLLRIQQAKADTELRQGVEAALAQAIPGFIDTVSRTIHDAMWDDRFQDWDAAWRWAFVDNWLRKRSDFSYQDRMWRRRHALEQEIRELLAESAVLRAWTHFLERLDSEPKESAALRGWSEAVRSQGKGTGGSAKRERIRREVRQYMDQCRESIPVWIMPRYLVAEMISSVSNRYDLVIVDEASQLGIESLFLFYIGEKMIVVGDDQQISPYGIGIADQDIADLQRRYLAGVPHQHALSAQSSLYTNAKIRFRQHIVLREHFRCMPEIIQFSNDLCYASNGTPLDPLRSYPPDRLTPLVVRHVKNGYRTGSAQYAINEPEADAIVSQIIGCIQDPRYVGRTMGVISLQGEAQAKLIEGKLLKALEPGTIEERRLICGDAYAFQGDERDVIFLSMVAAPNERIGTLSNESARQRFNVAASRARDQLWLFHTAGLGDLSPRCMRYRLLDYMLSPRRQPGPEEDRFESQFERDVCACVRARGFFVRTQVSVGDPTNHRYRIDLVVEGMQGRLAVECDGDEWHGPERYEQDMARQRDLERAGWQFVRIRGSDFYRDRTKALEPLWRELDRLGIKPGGIDGNITEPPPPAKTARVERAEIDESVDSDLVGITDPNDSQPRLSLASQEQKPVNRRYDATMEKFMTMQPRSNGDSFLGEYISYEGSAGPDPRIISIGDVADGLVRIIEVEGPMLAKRAYNIYLRGCGVRRLDGELKSTMNKALMSAIRQGKVVAENEPGQTGLLFATVRIKGTPPVKPRRRGPRTLEEIPPGELRYVGRYILETDNIEANSDEHLRAILAMFDLTRSTAQIRTSLSEILKRSAVGNGEWFETLPTRESHQPPRAGKQDFLI